VILIGTARVGLGAILSAGVLMYVASGRLITSRRPGNAIGWLLGSIGIPVACVVAILKYRLYDLGRVAPGIVPNGCWPRSRLASPKSWTPMR